MAYTPSPGVWSNAGVNFVGTVDPGVWADPAHFQDPTQLQAGGYYYTDPWRYAHPLTNLGNGLFFMPDPTHERSGTADLWYSVASSPDIAPATFQGQSGFVFDSNKVNISNVLTPGRDNGKYAAKSGGLFDSLGPALVIGGLALGGAGMLGAFGDTAAADAFAASAGVESASAADMLSATFADSALTSGGADLLGGASMADQVAALSGSTAASSGVSLSSILSGANTALKAFGTASAVAAKPAGSNLLASQPRAVFNPATGSYTMETPQGPAQPGGTPQNTIMPSSTSTGFSGVGILALIALVLYLAR